MLGVWQAVGVVLVGVGVLLVRGFGNGVDTRGVALALTIGATIAGYTLFDLTLAPAAAVAAVRETSILFAVALSAFMLSEPVSRGRVTGAALVVTGVALVALG